MGEEVYRRYFDEQQKAQLSAIFQEIAADIGGGCKTNFCAGGDFQDPFHYIITTEGVPTILVMIDEVLTRKGEGEEWKLECSVREDVDVVENILRQKLQSFIELVDAVLSIDTSN